jgi:hypothetical protein
MQSPNPAIDGAAIVKGLDPNQATAQHHDADRAQAVLDEADLHEMDQAEYYGDAGAATDVSATRPRRSLLDRLLRR